MIETSVILCQQDEDWQSLERQIGDVASVLDPFDRTYEILVVYDGPADAVFVFAERLLAKFPQLRVVSLDRSCGTSTALSVGLDSVRGKVVVFIEAGEQYDCRQIPEMLRRLSRADAVFGKRPARGWAKLWQRIARVPRALLLGLEVRDPGCLFWAARREAVSRLELSHGMARYLSSLITMRGYRVAEVAVRTRGASARRRNALPNPGDLLACWWLRRRYRPHHVEEIVAGEEERAGGGERARGRGGEGENGRDDSVSLPLLRAVGNAQKKSA